MRNSAELLERLKQRFPVNLPAVSHLSPEEYSVYYGQQRMIQYIEALLTEEQVIDEHDSKGDARLNRKHNIEGII